MNKKLGYALIISSFLFSWIHISIILDYLYRGILVLVVTDENEIKYLLSTSPFVDFAGSSESSIIFLMFTFVLGILLLGVGVYFVIYTNSKVEDETSSVK